MIPDGDDKVGASSGAGNGNGGDNVIGFPATAEERRQLRQARLDAEKRRLVHVFIDEGGGQLFCSSDKAAFADLIVNGHRETWEVRSQEFRHAYVQYLNRELTRALTNSEAPMQAVLIKSAMRKAAVNAAIEDFEICAICAPTKRSVHVRVAEHASEIFVDLCNDDWEAVRVTAAGWSIVESPPVRFIRTAGMLPLPRPARDGRIEVLRPFVNVADADFPLVVAHLLVYLRPRGPYPNLDLCGPPGAAKSNFMRRLRRLVDPHEVETGALPLSGEDLFIAARNSHLQAFENVSALSTRMSDNLCRLATGGGLRTRRRFTNTRETLFRGARPIVIEGIANIVKRSDFLDRATVFEVERLPDYASEEDLDLAFDRQRPVIFGALLDMLVRGLRMRSTTTLTLPKPRMVDFALWAVACGVDQFEAAYARNRQNAISTLLEYDPVAKAVRRLMTDRRQWRGTVGGCSTSWGLRRGSGPPGSSATTCGCWSRCWRPSASALSGGSERRPNGRSRSSEESDAAASFALCTRVLLSWCW
jgi:hypothetical protein